MSGTNKINRYINQYALFCMANRDLLVKLFFYALVPAFVVLGITELVFFGDDVLRVPMLIVAIPMYIVGLFGLVLAPVRSKDEINEAGYGQRYWFQVALPPKT